MKLDFRFRFGASARAGKPSAPPAPTAEDLTNGLASINGWLAKLSRFYWYDIEQKCRIHTYDKTDPKILYALLRVKMGPLLSSVRAARPTLGSEWVADRFAFERMRRQFEPQSQSDDLGQKSLDAVFLANVDAAAALVVSRTPHSLLATVPVLVCLAVAVLHALRVSILLHY